MQLIFRYDYGGGGNFSLPFSYWCDFAGIFATRRKCDRRKYDGITFAFALLHRIVCPNSDTLP